jgi:hypothetical protein
VTKNKELNINGTLHSFVLTGKLGSISKQILESNSGPPSFLTTNLIPETKLTNECTCNQAEKTGDTQDTRYDLN